MDRIHDLALGQRQGFILDGMLSNHAKAKESINRSPGRRENVNHWKNKSGKDISAGLILKEIDGSRKLYKAGVDQIDHHIPENYTKTDIEKVTGSG